MACLKPAPASLAQRELQREGETDQEEWMRIIPVILLLGLASPAFAQGAEPAEQEEIVIVGLRDGATVVEVDFDKVWRRCAECKRALAKLDLLAKTYRDELELAGLMAGGGVAGGSSATPSTIGTWQRSSANDTPTTAGGLAAARRSQTSSHVYQELAKKHVIPERMEMTAHMRSFLDQLTPHVVTATEQERLERGARASLIGERKTKLAAKRLVRIDVTDAVIKRLDAQEFTIELPDPSAKEARK